MKNSNFPKSVFINCPFTYEYVPLLRPLIFTILYLGYNPRICSENFDSGKQRIDTICRLIQVCRFSVHDLSKMRAERKNELFRMNMPFELGIDFGCRRFKDGKARTKKCLILETKQYRYQKAISDLSGVDIKKHNDDPQEIVRQIRNWFVENKSLRTAPSPSVIWDNFNEFMADFYQLRKKKGFKSKDLQRMPIPEYINFIKHWLAQ